ncbi:hypothetical protein F4780DRAFT_265568 [Xylariomycetidae sp. FL0641]|nr:hypothetical protein F4780DRAFT_265568 [Xylariomycetidae sp. FL0641]
MEICRLQDRSEEESTMTRWSETTAVHISRFHFHSLSAGQSRGRQPTWTMRRCYFDRGPLLEDTTAGRLYHICKAKASEKWEGWLFRDRQTGRTESYEGAGVHDFGAGGTRGVSQHLIYRTTSLEIDARMVKKRSGPAGQPTTADPTRLSLLVDWNRRRAGLHRTSSNSNSSSPLALLHCQGLPCLLQARQTRPDQRSSVLLCLHHKPADQPLLGQLGPALTPLTVRPSRSVGRTDEKKQKTR